MRSLTIVALVLLVIGGLNWLLVGAFQFDLVAAIFGTMSMLSRAVYVLVGLAAIYVLIITPRLLPRSGVARGATNTSTVR